jgi:hypothetical protein
MALAINTWLLLGLQANYTECGESLARITSRWFSSYFAAHATYNVVHCKAVHTVASSDHTAHVHKASQRHALSHMRLMNE